MKGVKSNMNTKRVKIPEKYQQVPVINAGILLFLWSISLGLPNIIYSGVSFADTLHIIKWAVTGVPIGIALVLVGIRMLRYGQDRLKLNIDVFGLIWLMILVYCVFQPLWVKISSPTGYALEMVCFAAVWAFYVLSVRAFPDWGLRIVLILANINSALNVMFAELQIRNMNNLEFLRGTFLSDVVQFSNVILPTPGNYIGNTAQQNMFGLWTAVATLGAVYLYVYDAWKDSPEEHGRKVFVPVLLTALSVVCFKFAVTDESVIFALLGTLAVISALVMSVTKLGGGNIFSSFVLLLTALNFWGLMNSTSRSATLALIVGLTVLLIIAAWKFDRNYVMRFGAVMLVIAAVFWASLYSPRSEQIVDKTADIIQNAENIGNRRGIWMTSYAMLLEHPEGVGVGQYKWHYLEGQREGFKRVSDSWYRWQYTHWAHNEFLQFFCEGGFIGGIMLLLMWFAWFIPAVYGLFKSGRYEVGTNAVWGLALASLITFCAIFTRPFHRIENMVWITLAFALSNREFYPKFSLNLDYSLLKTKILHTLCALIFISGSLTGFVYIWSGIEGNYVLRQALSTQREDLQLYYLNEAQKHPIVREEAIRNLGYHYLQLGEQKNEPKLVLEGFNILWEHFKREPKSEDLSKLLNLTQRYQIEPVLREIAGYFKPGTYHLKRIPQRDASGRTVNALLMVNGAGSDDR